MTEARLRQNLAPQETREFEVSEVKGEALLKAQVIWRHGNTDGCKAEALRQTADRRRTMKPEAPTIVPTEDVGLLDLPPSVLVIVRAAGVTSYNDFAWSWNEEELRKELEKGGVVLGEIDWLCAS